MRSETTDNKHLMLFSDGTFPELAKEVMAILETDLVPIRILAYTSSEIYVRLRESVHGCDAFVIQPHTAPVNEWTMEQLITMDTLKRASAKRITVVVPSYPHACQDKKYLGRGPILTRLVADLYRAARVDRIVSIDLHTSRIQGSFGGPMDHLQGLPVLSDYARKHYDTSETCVVPPGAGRIRLAGIWADELGCPLTIIHGRHDHEAADMIAVHEVVGDTQGRACILVDDMIGTAGTITQAVLALQERGANKVACAATYTVFSGPAVKWLNKSGMAEIIVTNVLPTQATEPVDNLTVLLITPSIVRTINTVFRGGLMTSLFGGQTYK